MFYGCGVMVSRRRIILSDWSAQSRSAQNHNSTFDHFYDAGEELGILFFPGYRAFNDADELPAQFCIG